MVASPPTASWVRAEEPQACCGAGEGGRCARDTLWKLQRSIAGLHAEGSGLPQAV